MIFLARNRLRALIILIFAHDMQINVAHALCKQGCRLISYTVNIRLVTIAACYNCPRSPLHIPGYVWLRYLFTFETDETFFMTFTPWGTVVA